MLNVYLPRVKIVFIIIIISIFGIFLVQFFFFQSLQRTMPRRRVFRSIACQMLYKEITRFSANSVFFHSGFEDGFKKLVQCVH